MIKEIAWKTFKNTGDINTFMELRQLENFESTNIINGFDKRVEANEYRKNEGNNNCGE